MYSHDSEYLMNFGKLQKFYDVRIYSFIWWTVSQQIYDGFAVIM